MREIPILFSAPMVRAILAGKKTQTRRLVRDVDAQAELLRVQPGFPDGTTRPVFLAGDGEPFSRKPYAAVGDRLWVRETWCEAVEEHRDVRSIRQAFYRADTSPEAAGEDSERCRQDYIAAGYPYRWRPSIFMQRWAARLILEVTDIRVERLRDISGADILREGAVARPHDCANLGRCPVSAFDGRLYPDLTSLWRAGWDSINGKRAPWASNPWVWCVAFKAIY